MKSQKSPSRTNAQSTSLTRQLIPPPDEDPEPNANRPDYTNKFLQGIFSMDPAEVKEQIEKGSNYVS